MNYQTSSDIVASYNNSGNSYSYTYITNNITESFNTTQTNSHNGHARGGWCGIVAILLGLGIPAAVLLFILSVLSEVLT